MSNNKEKSNSLGRGLLKALKEIALFEGGKGNLRTTSIEKPNVSVDSLLKGIGCNMMAEEPKDLSPEECLVELSHHLLQDTKALVLAIGAVTAHADVFSPEAIMRAMQSRKCDFNVVGALMIKASEERFRKVIEFCREQKFASPTPSKTLTFAFNIGQAEADKEFQVFGIDISRLGPVDEKKITKPEFFPR
ncbi:MAG: hypothetical protein ACKOX6_11170 [Bdellovibrio sp.]